MATIAACLLAVRSNTYHDSDTQFTDTQLTVAMDSRLQRLRRRISMAIPTLYESQSAQTVASGANTITKPTSTERIRSLEKLISGVDYYMVPVQATFDQGNPEELSWQERGNTIVLLPVADASGTYRLTVVLGVVTIVGVSTATAVDLPSGMEDVLIEECSAWARQRHNEDPSYHLAEAARIYKEQIAELRKRYGVHPEPGLQTVRGWL